MSKRAKATVRRRDKRATVSLKRRDAQRMKEWGVTHLGYALYGKSYDPEKHGTPY